MSLYDYHRCRALEEADEPFYGLVMAAMQRADSDNRPKLQGAFPGVWRELRRRYDAPRGLIRPGEHDEEFELRPDMTIAERAPE